ncbi:MAG: hypothetical protein QOD72_3420 [Acidimicrobiaceae bacterium]|nr:hypothetical protein [Acidimicrobiaceae bacterium]
MNRSNLTTRTIVLALLVLAACSNGGGASKGSAGSAGAASSGSVVLKAPTGTSLATIQAAADIVRARLIRMKVTVSSVAARPDGVAVASSADAYQIHAAARRGATALAAISSTALGPCNGVGEPSAGPAVRCYVLGATATGFGAVTDAVAQPASGAGWKVTFTVDPNQYRAFRASIEAAGAGPLAVVSDGVVVLAFNPGVPALQSSFGPGLTEEQAKLDAAVLVVDADLPVALDAPGLPPAQGARVNQDFWTAALGVRICGAWLANAPTAGLDTGVHSHGDGLIYVHPFTADEAGGKATLGLFLKRGTWKVSADSLQLWDGVLHRSGEPCANGSPGNVRWWVDGVEQQGNPADFVPQNGQVIVLNFDSDASPPGPPPQMSALYLPTLSPSTS